MDHIESAFRRHVPELDEGRYTLRVVHERTTKLTMRQDVLQPVTRRDDRGLMVTAFVNGGMGYAATSDISEAGIKSAIAQAGQWATATAKHALIDWRTYSPKVVQGHYQSPVEAPFSQRSLSDNIEVLQSLSKRLKCHDLIVDWLAALWATELETLYLDNAASRCEQQLSLFTPMLQAVANSGSETQVRSSRGGTFSQQGGWETITRIGMNDRAESLAAQAVALLDAPNCPSGKMDVVIDPEQMMLQIHESIGHPLELDRILGDERNYAGTSFVTQEMFGSYQYGSELLNVTFDPTEPHQFANYGFDDDGTASEKQYIIKDGILVRPLGGAISQHRADMPGVANARACHWNRPPIDRMANLNVEAGDSNLDDLIGSVEHGIFMQSNRSWSIDDSRNKFQFGCEWGQLIENGELKGPIKNPNYRGISATFWRCLSGLTTHDTRKVMGTPYCGKGEPNQVIWVGHASPFCRFSNIDVFGGA